MDENDNIKSTYHFVEVDVDERGVYLVKLLTGRVIMATWDMNEALERADEFERSMVG